MSKPILRWTLTIAAGMALGLLAARIRLLDSATAVVGLGVLIAVLIALGIRTTAEPWDDRDD